MSQPVLAGLIAWGIEIAVAAIMLSIVKHEESKCVKRRNRKDD